MFAICDLPINRCYIQGVCENSKESNGFSEALKSIIKLIKKVAKSVWSKLNGEDKSEKTLTSDTFSESFANDQIKKAEERYPITLLLLKAKERGVTLSDLEEQHEYDPNKKNPFQLAEESRIDSNKKNRLQIDA